MNVSQTIAIIVSVIVSAIIVMFTINKNTPRIVIARDETPIITDNQTYSLQNVIDYVTN